MAKKTMLLSFLALVLSVTAVFAQNFTFSDLCIAYMDNYSMSAYALAEQEVIFSMPDAISTVGFTTSTDGTHSFFAFMDDYEENQETGRITVESFDIVTAVSEQAPTVIHVTGKYRGMSLSDDGILLYSHEAEGTWNLYAYDTQSGITTSLPPAIFPSWGPNGVYTATIADGSLVAFYPDGTNRVLTNNGRYGSWSPSGELFAYSEYPYGAFVVLNFETGEEIFRAPDTFWAEGSSWISEAEIAVSGVFDTDTEQHLNLYVLTIGEDWSIAHLHNELGRDLYAPRVYTCVRNRSNEI